MLIPNGNNEVMHRKNKKDRTKIHRNMNRTTMIFRQLLSHNKKKHITKDWQHDERCDKTRYNKFHDLYHPFCRSFPLIIVYRN